MTNLAKPAAGCTYLSFTPVLRDEALFSGDDDRQICENYTGIFQNRIISYGL